MTALLIAAAVAVGYLLGRARPAHRASDWAHWQTVGTPPARRTARWWAVWAVLSTENIGWLLSHPVKGWHAWQHRNDPPPPRSPAVKIRRATEGPQ
ncbi:hypothetical protein [Streptomyces bottropensis]|uniref:hypothetical protein n=1 Tax=Streptomyces bottropensis TaxID=42235 RepID=UPI003676C102